MGHKSTAERCKKRPPLSKDSREPATQNGKAESPCRQLELLASYMLSYEYGNASVPSAPGEIVPRPQIRPSRSSHSNRPIVKLPAQHTVTSRQALTSNPATQVRCTRFTSVLHALRPMGLGHAIPEVHMFSQPNPVRNPSCLAGKCRLRLHQHDRRFPTREAMRRITNRLPNRHRDRRLFYIPSARLPHS